MKTLITADRYHDFSYGHRVYGHESVCGEFHGHNGRVYFTIQAPELDEVGRVMDFAIIKTLLCQWIEDNWDHKFLLYEKDFLLPVCEEAGIPGIISVPFNPTSENMAGYLVEEVGPKQLQGTGAKLVKAVFEETRKCSATVKLGE